MSMPICAAELATRPFRGVLIAIGPDHQLIIGKANLDLRLETDQALPLIDYVSDNAFDTLRVTGKERRTRLNQFLIQAF